WLYSGSVIDLGVIAGALSAALLAREFAIRVPRPGELVKGGLGGALMGLGGMLALGCNIGGVFCAARAPSLLGPGLDDRALGWRLHRTALSRLGDGEPADVVERVVARVRVVGWPGELAAAAGRRGSPRGPRGAVRLRAVGLRSPGDLLAFRGRLRLRL